MHIYEIMLANGDRVEYRTEMTFDELKQYISENEWIEIERAPWVSISKGWESRPTNASYQTKSVVYVNWDEEWERYCKDREKRIEKQRELKKEILKYKPNLKLIWRYRWRNTPWLDDEEDDILYVDGYLEQLLKDCIECGCKKIE